MIIDVHGHFTTLPPSVAHFRETQIEQLAKTGTAPDLPLPIVDDEAIRDALEKNGSFEKRVA